MIAALQRRLLLAALAASAIWAVRCALLDRPYQACNLVIGLAATYAAIMGTEFLLMLAVARSRLRNYDKNPGAGEILRAGFDEFASSVQAFLWRQPFASQKWPDAPRPAAPGHRGVVLVHGYFCNRGLWNGWLSRLSAQGTPFIAVNLEPPFASISSYANAIEVAVQEIERQTGLAPVVVAHSMGGLAVRAWWSACSISMPEVPSEQRLRHLITLGTPHHGTWLASFAFTANARQMRLNSPWLRSLDQQEPASHRMRMTCYYSTCDNIVFPCEVATLERAQNIRLDGVAHVGMVGRPEPFAELQRLLANPGLTD